MQLCTYLIVCNITFCRQIRKSLVYLMETIFYKNDSYFILNFSSYISVNIKFPCTRCVHSIEFPRSLAQLFQIRKFLCNISIAQLAITSSNLVICKIFLQLNKEKSFVNKCNKIVRILHTLAIVKYVQGACTLWNPIFLNFD